MTKLVYTFRSIVKIKKENISEALGTLKTYYTSNKEIQAAYTLKQALKSYNWIARTNSIYGNIESLEYDSERWDFKSQVILNTIARFVEPGGVIYMADETNKRNPMFWALKFSQNSLIRSTLVREFIDYESPDKLKILFERIGRNLIKQGESSHSLKAVISKLFVESMLNN